MKTYARLLFVLLPLWVLAGCSALDRKVDFGDPIQVNTRVEQVLPPAQQANGAIFQAAAYRPLFEDHRARLVGDTLTVQIIEKVTATQSASSNVDRSASVEAEVGSLAGLSARRLDRLSASGSSSNTFGGKGSTASNNSFSGTITATVVDVLPNGHLIVAGEKQIGVNANVDVLRFSGQVDPRNILPGNIVPSAQIANVRLEQKGYGQQADAQFMGWLARFFLSVLPI